MQALDFFDPINFGFRHRTDVPFPARKHAWVKNILPLGEVRFTMLSWQHAQQKIPWQDGSGEVREITFLELVAQMQSLIWGIRMADTLPPIDMAIIDDTGGYLGVAYRDTLTADNWLGFVLGFGSITGVLASHMLGTNPRFESHGIGYHLKLLQAYEALRVGHHAMEWTFDPMRGKNAYLNFRKLGAYGSRYLVSKYGEFNSTLYGQVPTDRIIMHWALTDTEVHRFLSQPPSIDLTDIVTIPTVTAQNVKSLVAEQVPRLKVEIPGDIDSFSVSQPTLAIEWRHNLRTICSHLLDSKRSYRGSGNPLDPATLAVEYHHGAYQVADFVTGFVDHDRRSFYIFSLKEN